MHEAESEWSNSVRAGRTASVIVETPDTTGFDRVVHQFRPTNVP